MKLTELLPDCYYLNRSDNLYPITEGRGEQVLKFIDYLSADIKIAKVREDFLALGKALFKDGWEFERGLYSPKFTLDDDSGLGTGWTITFPAGDKHDARSGIIQASWYGFKVTPEFKEELCSFTFFESASSVMSSFWGLNKFKEFLLMQAKPKRRT